MSASSQYGKPFGFTLVELLVVAAVATIIVAGLAEGLGLFARQVEVVRAESDKGPDEAMALMTDMARYGWLVENPGENRLDVVDALGARTTFAVVDGDLRVTRPSGVSGVLLSGVASLSVDAEVGRRVREAPPVDEHRAWWHVPGEAPDRIDLESGLPVGLGFTLSSVVPEEFDVVDGIDEHSVLATLDTLVVSMAYVGTFPDDPNAPIAGEGGGGGGGGGGGNHKVTICHVPPGNPAKRHTLKISENALAAHLAHGDWVGSCDAPPDVEVYPDLTIQLFEARAPDDARPVGQPLAAFTVTSLALPLGTARWVPTATGTTHDEHDHGVDECAATTADGKVVICHVPPGNPANARTLTIAPAAVSAHLAHGDYFGNCGQHDEDESIFTLEIDAEPAAVEIDLSPLGAVILPGRAYTLVLSLSGPGVLHIGATTLGTSVNTGVAQATAAYGALQPAAASVPFVLQGMHRITQTAEHEPIARVSLELALGDGRSVRGSASVLGQAGVPGLWMGAVSGQVAEIAP